MQTRRLASILIGNHIFKGFSGVFEVFSTFAATNLQKNDEFLRMYISDNIAVFVGFVYF